MKPGIRLSVLELAGTETVDEGHRLQIPNFLCNPEQRSVWDA